MKNIRVILWTFIIFIFASASLFASDVINKIHINSHKVFEESDKDWFLGAGLFNSLHPVTKDYIIADELLFNEGGGLFEEEFQETERNLRATGLFSNISIELEEVSAGLYDVYVETKDRWSLYPSVIIGANGGEYAIGARLKDYNLLGHGIMLNLDGAYIWREDTSGYHYNLELEKRRLFRSEFNIFMQAYNTYLRNSQTFRLEKPFRTINTETAFGIEINNMYGDDYFRNRECNIIQTAISDTTNNPTLKNDLSANLIHSDEQKIKLWYAKGWASNDKVYISALLEWQQANRTYNILNRAYDNQSKFLLGFSSVAHTYYTVQNINAYNYEDLAIGGWGDIVLGAVVPSNKRGEKGLFYIGMQLEKSYYTKNFYIFMQIATSSSFSSDFAKYTYFEFQSLMFYKIMNKLTLAARIKEQAVWNYPRMRQLFIDDIRGIRGYNMQELAGDNRFVSNIELRYFPDWRLSLLQFSFVGFADIGAVWNQKVTDAVFKARYYTSAGFGIRGHFTKSDNPDHIIRVDVPFNFSTKRFGLSLGVQQYFSAFSSHRFQLPAIYGNEYNFE